jgi:hypothetical protein
MDNYPPGAKYDSSAPWNQPDPSEYQIADITIESDMLVIHLTWEPYDEDMPSRIELFDDDLFPLIEKKIY